MKPPVFPEDLRGALVVAVDDSPQAREALRYAATMAVEARKPLHVLTIWNFVNGEAPAGSQDTPVSEAAWQEVAERRLAELVAAEVGGRDGLELRPLAVHGNTVPTLLELTKVVGHLVVGSRGRGGFSGLLLGSTSEQLVRHAGCPITIVRHGCTSD